jgi:ADP-heptose:LPS heptosyltransferase
MRPKSKNSRVETVLESLPRGSRILVIRLRSLGDCVLTTPALDLLKRFRPDLAVAVAVEDRFRAVFEANPDIDEMLPPSLGAVRRAVRQESLPISLEMDLRTRAESGCQTRPSG